jgi:hypothetical protein
MSTNGDMACKLELQQAPTLRRTIAHEQLYTPNAAARLEVSKFASVRSSTASTWETLMEQSAEDFCIGEATAAQESEGASREFGDACGQAAERVANTGNEGFYVNPLREAPRPAVTGTVRQFGVVGLIACAVSAGLTRWFRSSPSRRRESA